MLSTKTSDAPPTKWCRANLFCFEVECAGWMCMLIIDGGFFTNRFLLHLFTSLGCIQQHPWPCVYHRLTNTHLSMIHICKVSSSYYGIYTNVVSYYVVLFYHCIYCSGTTMAILVFVLCMMATTSTTSRLVDTCSSGGHDDVLCYDVSYMTCCTLILGEEFWIHLDHLPTL